MSNMKKGEPLVKLPLTDKNMVADGRVVRRIGETSFELVAFDFLGRPVLQKKNSFQRPGRQVLGAWKTNS
jgi:hypothetical protein